MVLALGSPLPGSHGGPHKPYERLSIPAWPLRMIPALFWLKWRPHVFQEEDETVLGPKVQIICVIYYLVTDTYAVI